MEVSNLVGVAIGGVLAIGGGVVAQVMQGRREQHKWFEEKCIEEYRELLDILTRTLMLTAQSYTIDANKPDSSMRRGEWEPSWHESLRIIRTRLFIARQIQEADIYKKWTDAFDSLPYNNNIVLLTERYEEIRRSIVAMAMKRL